MSILTGKKWDKIKDARPFRAPRTCGARLLEISKKDNQKFIFDNVDQEIKDRLTLMDYANWIAGASASAITSQYGVPPEPPQYDVSEGEEKEG